MQQGVELFRTTYNLPVSNTPRALTPEEAALHIRLIRDEFEKELVPALESGDVVEIYDAVLDVNYFLLGLLSNAGMDAEPGFDAVQASNMSKLGEDGLPIYAVEGDDSGEPAGKVLKGPNYFKPDLATVLRAQGWNG